MTDRKTLKVSEQTYDTLAEHKRDGETWDGCLQRLAQGEQSIRVVVDRPNERTDEHDLEEGPIDIASDGPIAVRVQSGSDE